MKKLYIVILILFVFSFISACGAGTPERQAQLAYEHEKRYDAEMERLKSTPPETQEKSYNNFLVDILLLFIGIGIGWGSCIVYNNNFTSKSSKNTSRVYYE